MFHKKTCILLLVAVFMLSSLAELESVDARAAFSIYTPKDIMIQQWKDLCDEHVNYASYEVIGHTVEGRDIWLFAIGNPDGGKIMYDGELHGWEDGGTECMLKFAQWLLESNDPQAEQFLYSNYNLFIPVVNVDSSTRQNMRRTYVLENGSVIHVLYGVDLNRNAPYGWGRSGRSDPADEYSYRGLYAGSEPEIQALRNALDKYHPQIYLNTHLGDSYMLYRSNTTFEAKIRELILNNTQKLNTSAYSMRRRLGGGTVAADADESFGASGWLIEIAPVENLPNTRDAFLNQYYPSLFAIFLAFNQAVENKTSDNPSDKFTPTPTPSPTSQPIIDENPPILAVMLGFLVVVAFLRKTGKLKTKTGSNSKNVKAHTLIFKQRTTSNGQT